MDMFIHQLMAGIANGAIYTLLALALVLTYQASGHINFAQGEMAMLSTYVAWWCLRAGMPYWAAFGATLLLSFGFGAAVERLVLRPARNEPPLTTVALLIGVLAAVHSLAGLLFGYVTQSFPSPFAPEAWYASGYLSAHQAGTVLVAACVIAVLYGLLYRTRFGLAMRAAARHPGSSQLVGIRLGPMLSLGWGLAAAIGAIGGMLAAPVVYLDPSMMNGIILYGFAAALIGGIDSHWGALAGGMLVGVLDNLAGAYLIGTELKIVVALGLIVAVLLVKPSGLFGRSVLKRV